MKGFSPLLPNEETEKRIENCCLHFLESLIAAEDSSTATVAFKNPCEEGNGATYSVRLNCANTFGFTFVSRALAQTYGLIVSGAAATKRDLFYEQKYLYGTQRNLDASVTKVCRLINTSRVASNILATGRGIMMGKLVISENDRTLDCSVAPVVIGSFSEDAVIQCTAAFVLVIEKDAIFQKVIQEGFFSFFKSAIIVTGKGYPDISTRRLLRRITAECDVPIFGLMDSDPHGIEIAMTYKYGSIRKSVEVGELDLPNFTWIGLSRSEVDRYPVPQNQFLSMNKKEMRKAAKLSKRATELEDWVLLRELNCLLATGTKLELEAVSGITAGFICEKVLGEKLCNFVDRLTETGLPAVINPF